MRRHLCGLAGPALVASCSSDKPSPVELTRAGACGDFFLAAYGASAAGDLAVYVYMPSAEVQPFSQSIELPSDLVEMELLTGDRVDETLCADLPRGRVDDRVQPESGQVTIAAKDGVATIRYEGVAEFEDHGLANGEFSAPIGPAPG